MPTPPGYADVSVKLKHVLVSRPAYITFGVDPATPDPGTLGTALETAFNIAGGIKTLFDTDVTITEFRMSFGTDGAEDIVATRAVAITGTAAGLGFPPNVAILVRKETARGGRRGRGRFFLPWTVAEGQVDEAGIMQASEVTRFGAALEVTRLSLSNGGNPMVVLHSPSGPEVTHPTTAGPPDVVTIMRVDSLVSTQRRRLGR